MSGYFLSSSVQKKGTINAIKAYDFKIAVKLLFWLTLYTPFILIQKNQIDFFQLIQEFLFMTPAYLWYLTGLLVASIPFVLIHNKTYKY